MAIDPRRILASAGGRVGLSAQGGWLPRPAGRLPLTLRRSAAGLAVPRVLVLAPLSGLLARRPRGGCVRAPPRRLLLGLSGPRSSFAPPGRPVSLGRALGAPARRMKRPVLP
jgi:hypothetical protein